MPVFGRPGAIRLFVFEVNWLTLPLILFGSVFFSPVHYGVCPSFFARRFGRHLQRCGAIQITEKEALNDGSYGEGRRRILLAARRIGRRYGSVGQLLARHGKADAYEGFADTVFLRSIQTPAFLSTFIEPFLRRVAATSDRVLFLSMAPREAFEWSATLPANVVHLSLSFFGWPIRLASVALLALFPLFNLLLLARKGIRPTGRSDASALERDVLLVHREADLLDSRTDYYRDLYFLREDILEADRCLHLPMATGKRFSNAKKALIEAQQGMIVELGSVSPSWSRWWRLAFAEPMRFVMRAIPRLLACRIWSTASARYLAECLHFMSLVPLLLDCLRVRLVVAETEVSPFCQILAREARKKGIPTVSMIHGSGGQHTLGPTRFEMQFRDLLVYGHWYGPLREFNPAIERFVPIGNIEIDHLDPDERLVLAKQAGRKVVAFFARLSHVLTTGVSAMTGSAYVDRREELDRGYLIPFLEWVALRDDIFLVWKAPYAGLAQSVRRDEMGRAIEISWQPWLQKAITAIPAERFLACDHLRLEQVVGMIDVGIGNDVSSAIACAMSAGRPAISYDLIFGGQFRRYHPQLAATDPFELIENLEWLLENPLPQNVFDQFNSDFYGSTTVDFNSHGRLRAYFASLLAA